MNQLLENLIGILDDGLIVYDNNFLIIYFNKGVEEMLNIRAQDIIGKSFTLEEAQKSDWKLLSPIIYSSLAPTVIRLSEVGEDPQIVKVILENPYKEFEVRTSQVLDDKKQPVLFIKLIKNKTRESALLKSKSDFITVAAHQLRTPATAVNWSLENLKKDESLNASVKESIDVGYRASQNLLKIINDLLNVVQIEEGRFDYKMQKINLVEFLDKLLLEALLVAKEYKVNLYFDKALESVFVSADPDRLGLAVSNLIDNAVKYNISGGQVVVSLKIKDNFVEVVVRDTGVGIPEEDMPQIFTKFFRAKNIIKSSVAGSGLGLYLVKNIITEHGGKIWLESVINRGSVFYFTLPLVK